MRIRAVHLDGSILFEKEVEKFPVTIGRSNLNDLVVPDSSVSGNHLLINRSKDGIEVRDVGSTNGSRLNGKPLEMANICLPSKVQIGFNVTLVFEESLSKKSVVGGKAGRAGHHGIVNRLWNDLEEVRWRSIWIAVGLSIVVLAFLNAFIFGGSIVDQLGQAFGSLLLLGPVAFLLSFLSGIPRWLVRRVFFFKSYYIMIAALSTLSAFSSHFVDPFKISSSLALIASLIFSGLIVAISLLLFIRTFFTRRSAENTWAVGLFIVVFAILSFIGKNPLDRSGAFQMVFESANPYLGRAVAGRPVSPQEFANDLLKRNR